jgi:hypothetical protein
MRRLTGLIIALAATCVAGPKEFGLAELNKALGARGVELKIETELNLDPPETFRIEPYPSGRGARITGGDLRGLMYGQIEAADQIRSTGKIARVDGEPSIVLRGVRLALTDSPKFAIDNWRTYVQMLAVARFNRVTAVLDHFPSELEQSRLRALSQIAVEHGLDFILGLPPLDAVSKGIDAQAAGVQEADALTRLLTACPQIRGVEIPPEKLKLALHAQHAAGRLISIDLTQKAESTQGGVAVRAPASVALDASSTGEVNRRTLTRLDPAAGFKLEVPPEDESNASVYRLWGRLAYDLKPPSSR